VPAGPAALVEPARQASRRFVAAVVLATASASALAGIGLTREPLRDDEFLTLALVSRPFRSFVETLPDRQNGILYDIVLWPIVHAGGVSPAWLRLPALLAVVGSVVVCAFIGRRLVSDGVGLVAAWLLALNPFAIVYAQEARPYGFVLFFAAASVLALLRALERPGAPRWLAYAATVVALGYSHDFAILSLAAHPVLVAGHDRRAWYGLVGSLAVAAAALLPLVLFVPDDWGTRALDWVPPAAGAGLDTATGFTGGVAGLVVAVVALCAGVVALTRRMRRGCLPFARRLPVFLAIWLLAPVMILGLASLYRDVLVPRFVIQSLPALCLALAILQTVLPRRVGAATIAAVGAAFLAYSIAGDVNRSRADWPGVAQYVAGRSEPEEAIVAFGNPVNVANGLFYYAPQLGIDRTQLLFDRDDRERVPARVVLFDARRERAPDELVELARRGGLWLVRTPAAEASESAQQSLRQLTQRCESAFVKFRGIDVLHIPRCS
jgi:mannosyltransferase